MKPVDYIIIAIVAIIVFAATAYIIKAKKSGQKCIGCIRQSCTAIAVWSALADIFRPSASWSDM